MSNINEKDKRFLADRELAFKSENNLKEEEIIKDLDKYISFANKNENFSNDNDFKWNVELSQRIKGILDLYNKEKRKHQITINNYQGLIADVSTIAETLELEEDAPIDEIIEKINKEKEKNKELKNLVHRQEGIIGFMEQAHKIDVDKNVRDTIEIATNKHFKELESYISKAKIEAKITELDFIIEDVKEHYKNTYENEIEYINANFAREYLLELLEE